MTHTLEAIAWTLIHFFWQGACIAAGYRVLSPVFARRTSHARYLLALAALLLMLTASFATFAWELNAETASPALAATVRMDTKPSATQFAHAPDYDRLSAEAAAPSLSLGAALPWIDGLWLAGVIVLSLRSLGGYWLIQRLRVSASTDAPEAVRASFRRIAGALGLRRAVLLRVSSSIAGPLTVGALRAVVVLPVSAVLSLAPEELEVVLAHELAHIRRADFFWNLVQTLAETLFFFHPAVWWINARIRDERELCCDDLALQVCPNPVAYAEALLRLEEQRGMNCRLAMALDGHQSAHTLRRRIARILGGPAAGVPMRAARPLSLSAACAGFLVLLLTVPQLAASFKPSPMAALAPAAPFGASSSPAPGSLGGRSGSNPLFVASPAVMSPVANSQAKTHSSSMPDPLVLVAAATPQEKAAESAEPKGSYIDEMKAAGYDVDLDKLIAMKIQNVTPEYARAMAQLGFGKPSADDLVACKIQGVTPEYIAQLRQQGLEVKSLQDAVSYRIFQVTPEFVAAMKSAGFDHLSSQELLSLRVQGVTPEYARTIAQQFPGVTADDLVKTRIFKIDADFIAQAKKHGFTDLTLEKLVRLRISGIMDDESPRK